MDFSICNEMGHFERDPEYLGYLLYRLHYFLIGKNTHYCKTALLYINIGEMQI